MYAAVTCMHVCLWGCESCRHVVRSVGRSVGRHVIMYACTYVFVYLYVHLCIYVSICLCKYASMVHEFYKYGRVHACVHVRMHGMHASNIFLMSEWFSVCQLIRD